MIERGHDPVPSQDLTYSQFLIERKAGNESRRDTPAGSRGLHPFAKRGIVGEEQQQATEHSLTEYKECCPQEKRNSYVLGWLSMRVGVIGLGFMGSTHLKSLLAIPGAELVAVCSRDEAKLTGDLTGIQGNIGGPGAKMDFRGVAQYRDIRELLQDSQVEAVDICLPTNLHASVAIDALRAGKQDRKSTRLNSSHPSISYAVFCLK